jgi:hypothetical protein
MCKEKRMVPYEYRFWIAHIVVKDQMGVKRHHPVHSTLILTIICDLPQDGELPAGNLFHAESQAFA